MLTSTQRAPVNITLLFYLTIKLNYILADENDEASSFDHPTDSLVCWQTLGAGQKLTSEGWLFALFVTDKEMLLSFDSNPPITYYSGSSISFSSDINTSVSLEVNNGGLHFSPFLYPYVYEDHPLQNVKLGADGHLRGYVWQKQSSEWKEVDSLKEYIDYCDWKPWQYWRSSTFKSWGRRRSSKGYFCQNSVVCKARQT